MSRKAVFPWVLLTLAGPVLADDPQWRTDPENVLVVYASDDVDGDHSGKPDSAEVAEYYAARRGVPEGNLLGLKLRRLPGGKGHWTYPEFFEKILQPVGAKLSSEVGDGGTLAERICYVLLCPGVPIYMTTHPPAEKTEKLFWRKNRRRSVDGYLILIADNIRAGVDEKTEAPGPGLAGPLGADVRELSLPIFLAYKLPAAGKHFRQLRQLHPKRFGITLVGRLGLDLTSGRDMLDGALYAERYLRLPGAGEKAGLSPEIWLDQKYKFAQDHVAAMARTMAVVRGAQGSPFAGNSGLRRVWPLVIDNQESEIGMMVKGPAPASGPTSKPASAPASGPAEPPGPHKPTVTAKIAADGVGAKSVTLTFSGRIGRRGKDAPTVLYFPPYCRVTNGRATATVTGFDVKDNRLLLDSTEGFAGGDIIRHVWGGEYPARTCFLFYGFYGLGRYEDVFQFPPGALGIHVDSACMNWARGAIDRGIAATFGVTAEPLSAGIPYGDQVFLALADGYDWGEAAYGGLRLAQRWTGVVFGDPLYAPFRSLQLRDKTPPVLASPKVKVTPGGATISVQLAGADPDELADVALFKLEYGLTKTYGQMVDFFDWPEPHNSTRVRGRRFGYSRHSRWTLKGLQRGRSYHFRVTARDPAGLEAVTADAVFTLR